ncbi:hypothetical protein NN561_010677 [Cricetulus griseus]
MRRISGGGLETRAFPATEREAIASKDHPLPPLPGARMIDRRSPSRRQVPCEGSALSAGPLVRIRILANSGPKWEPCLSCSLLNDSGHLPGSAGTRRTITQCCRKSILRGLHIRAGNAGRSRARH